jgi:dUTP pyrophosphatase
MKKIKIKKLNPEATLPTRAYKYDAGLDLYALEDTFLPLGSTTKISTGIAVNIEPGYYAQINDRSGCAIKGLRVGAGVVDHGYQGELCVVMHNLNNNSSSKNYIKNSIITSDLKLGYQVRKGDRIAQLVIHKIELPEVVEVSEFEESERGNNGFNSTGR